MVAITAKPALLAEHPNPKSRLLKNDFLEFAVFFDELESSSISDFIVFIKNNNYWAK